MAALAMSDAAIKRLQVTMIADWFDHEIPPALQRVLALIGIVIVFICSFAVFISFNPVMPGLGLDPSWRYAINQAVAQKLVFGKDVIFTFGPYASIYTNVYHPVTDPLMIAGATCLAVGYGSMLIALMSRVNVFWTLIWLILMLDFMGSRDALFFSYALLFNICIYKYCFMHTYSPYSLISVILIGIISAPLGLLPLIKSSLALAVIPSIAITFVFLIYFKKYKIALSVLLVPSASLTLFWMWAGQPIYAIPQFFERSGYIVSGYSLAMSYTTSPLDVFIKQAGSFVFSAGLIVGVVATVKTSMIGRWFLVFSYGIFLFSSWKAGFVRHDNQHALIAGNALLIGSLSLCFIDRNKIQLVVFVVACASGFFIGGNHFINDAYSDMADGIKIRMFQNHVLKESFEQKINEIKKKVGFPGLNGKSDIYSYRQSALIASDNLWAPRPVLQSYSSYSTSLRQLDAEYLEGSSRPDNIFFRLETIDGRFPTLDSGASLLPIMNYYSVASVIGGGDYILLKKNLISSGVLPLKFSQPKTYKFEDNANLPLAERPMYAKIIFYPTGFGRLANFFLNAPPIFISVVLKDGSQRKYRVIPKMAESGFMISPLIESNGEALSIMTGRSADVINKAVTTISFTSSDTEFWFWKDAYTLSFSEK